jgi:hypothetical protein
MRNLDIVCLGGWSSELFISTSWRLDTDGSYYQGMEGPDSTRDELDGFGKSLCLSLLARLTLRYAQINIKRYSKRNRCSSSHS